MIYGSILMDFDVLKTTKSQTIVAAAIITPQHYLMLQSKVMSQLNSGMTDKCPDIAQTGMGTNTLLQGCHRTIVIYVHQIFILLFC